MSDQPDAPVTGDDGYVAALLDERRGFVMRGKKDRVAQVDAELARFGVAVDDLETGEAVDETEKRGPGRPRKG